MRQMSFHHVVHTVVVRSSVDDAHKRSHEHNRVSVHANRVKCGQCWVCVRVCEAPAVCKIRVRQMSN